MSASDITLFSPSVVVLLVSFLLFDTVSAVPTPCVPRRFGYDSVVCVCNATYCDFAPPTPAIPAQQYVLYTSSMGGLRFQQSSGSFVAMPKVGGKQGDEITITRENATDQTILGFGGAFTDASGINIKSLSNATQYLLMKSYFSPEGISYAFGRVPIGGCDFSTRAYTYDDIPNDKKLEKFNLTTEDFQYKIPLIQQANRLRGEPLRLVGSAWSAPAWMKTNNALTGRGELKTQYYQTWAQYLIMFLDFYKREQLSFWALTTGNEPINGDLPSFLPFVPKFNSMGWHPKSVATWIANNLGPTLRSSQHNATKILAIDDQRFVLPWWLEQMTADNSKVESYIDGVGIHWYWDQFIPVTVVDTVHKKYPRLLLINTEASIGDKPWDLIKVQLGSWSRAEQYISDIIENLNHGLVAWLEWNLALNTQGGTNWKNNFLDAPIIVNAAKDEFYKQPMFYAIGHFSRFIKPGSRVLKANSRSRTVEVLATIDKDENHVVVVLFNSGNKNVDITISDHGKRSIPLTLLKRSVVTLMYQA
ncbi:hypothetical protein M8J76_013795 [Diaphorina citri]|nr:hypothetical protein M8J75_010978 [Diaphorina citri]KAI5745730.1 hypothetical protein M8J76_013795 [Diaphorina citri]